MSEAEFERLLDAVNAAVAPIPQSDFITGSMTYGGRRKLPTTTGWLGH